jgi:WhiB family redox-sensing transcriptional regulator
MSLARTEATWRAAAACQGESAVLFFAPTTLEPRETKASREAAARALCHACAVREPCLEYALLVQEPHGIWGGLTELERRRLHRRAGTR